MKDFMNKFKVLMATLTCLFGISIFFINSGTLCNMIVKVLHLRVDPKFIGGEIVADFFDDSEEAIENLDLLRYTVHEPVYNAKWQQSPDYWQMDLEFKSGPANPRNVEIYIGLSNDKVWDFTVFLEGNEGKVYNNAGRFICNTEIGIKNDGKTVNLRIPLKDKELQQVYTALETYHFVLAGLNKDELTNVVENTVVADMKAASNHNEEEDKRFINDVVNKLLEFEQKDEYKAEESGEYFGFTTLDEALNHFEKEVKNNPDSAVPMAYYGSCLAMKGGQSNVMQAMTLVNKAFEYLDKAVELCKNDEERVDVLMNRASVCKSVPEAVFNKAKIGAEDYTKLAVLQKAAMKEGGLLGDEHEKYVLAYLYINGSQCYKTAGKETEAKILLQEAKKALK